MLCIFRQKVLQLGMLTAATFYLVRHGESAWNVKNLIQGQSTTHNPLTPHGQEQAIILSDIFNKIRIDEIFSSDLERATQTAKIIGKKMKLSVHTAVELREQNHGDYEGQKGSDNMSLFLGWKNLTEAEKEVLKIENTGESDIECTNRLKNFIKKIAVLYPLKTIMLVTHGGIMKHFLTYLEKLDENNGMTIDNTGYICIKCNGNYFDIETIFGFKKT